MGQPLGPRWAVLERIHFSWLIGALALLQAWPHAQMPGTSVCSASPQGCGSASLDLSFEVEMTHCMAWWMLFIIISLGMLYFIIAQELLLRVHGFSQRC